MKLKLQLLLLSLIWAITVAAQTGSAPQSPTPIGLDPVQGGWDAGIQKNTNADDEYRYRVMQEEVDLHQMNMEATFQQLRIDRNAALARNKGELTDQDLATLRQEVATLEQHAPNSFEAHMARFYLEFPSPVSFMSLDRAAMRAPERTELIGPKLADAARRNNGSELAQWSRRMKDHGQIAPGLLSFADDLLASVDRNGILFAAGEMDAYPLWTRQFADGSRTDVLVIDIRLLVDPAYRERIWADTRSTGKAPKDPGSFIKEFSASTERPVFLSPALGRDRIGLPPTDLYVVGLSLKVDRYPVNNIPLLEQRWAQMSKTTAAGPLSRNYLLPGVVLLKHYREQQNEEKTSALQFELRELAKKLNATQDLYRAGVFEH